MQSLPAIHGLIALDLANPAKPVEISRLKLGDTYLPHWTGWDLKTQRLVVTGSEPRLFLLKLDPSSGALTMDNGFHDESGNPGFNFADGEWPHG